MIIYLRERKKNQKNSQVLCVLAVVAGAQYQLSMSEPFTADAFDVTSCQRLKAALDQALLNEPVVAGGRRAAPFPQFLCRPADPSTSPSRPQPPSSPLLNSVNYYHRLR